MEKSFSAVVAAAAAAQRDSATANLLYDYDFISPLLFLYPLPPSSM
jgi:hypothetical protein